MSIPFFGEVIPQQGVSPDPSKIQVLTDMPPPKMKKELQSILGMLTPVTAELFEPLPRLTSVKTEWT